MQGDGGAARQSRRYHGARVVDLVQDSLRGRSGVGRVLFVSDRLHSRVTGDVVGPKPEILTDDGEQVAEYGVGRARLVDVIGYCAPLGMWALCAVALSSQPLVGELS